MDSGGPLVACWACNVLIEVPCINQRPADSFKARPTGHTQVRVCVAVLPQQVFELSSALLSLLFSSTSRLRDQIAEQPTSSIAIAIS